MPREKATFPSTVQLFAGRYSKRIAGRSACPRAKFRSCTRQERMYSATPASVSRSLNRCCSPNQLEVVKNSRADGLNCRSRSEYPVSSAVLPHGRPTVNSRCPPTSFELRCCCVNGPASWNALPRTATQFQKELLERYTN